MQPAAVHRTRGPSRRRDAYALTHEISQPLSATINYIAMARHLLDAGAEAGVVRRALDDASEQSLRTAAIIDRMRGLADGRPIAMRPHAVEPAVREAVALVAAEQALGGVAVRYSFDPAAPLMLGDRIQVQQILVNILRNAGEAMRDMPAHARRIDVGTRLVAPGTVKVLLHDAGPGLPEHVLSPIGLPVTSTKAHGMGLGLAISRRIARAHGGDLTGWNHPDGGACLALTLPTP